jgi:hypothetical protein
MSSAHHRHRFPNLQRISVPCALRASAVGHPFHRFSTPLFSASSELLFSQLLSFQEHLRCPMLFSNFAFQAPPSTASSAKSFIYRFYANSRANPFIYCIYEKHAGCGVSRSSVDAYVSSGGDCCSYAGRLAMTTKPRRDGLSAAATKNDRKNGHGCPVPLRPVLGAVTSTRKKGASLWA